MIASHRACLFASTLLLVGLAGPSAASAQRRFAVYGEGGSGVSVAGTDAQALVRRTPIYIEAGVVSWLANDDGVWLSGAARLEVEDRASVGMAGRAGFFLRADILELRPYVGLTTILAPYTLVGPEVGMVASIVLGGMFAISLRLLVDGFLAGSDLIPGTVLVMANAGLGVEIRL